MGKIIRFWSLGRRRLRGLEEFDERQRIRSRLDEPVRRSWHGMNQRRPKLPRYLRRTDNEVTARGVVRETVQWLGRLRPFILGGILLSIWPAADPALVSPPALLATEPETVDEQFARCGVGESHACVVDGDTFRLGGRRIRVIGIDAPETHPARCEQEAHLGEAATAKLQELLSTGPFEMAAWAHNRRDRYGRELMAVTRKLPDGSEQSIAAEMRDGGLARRYAGGFKLGWC